MELRHTLQHAQRIVIKAGTGIVTEPSGVPSLSRIGAIVEQICWLRTCDKEVILVSSGAVGIGRQLLRRQIKSRMADGGKGERAEVEKMLDVIGTKGYSATCAGAGQLGLLSLYETLFHQWDVPISQLLLTEFDFRSEDRYQYIRDTLTNLIRAGVVPILNENDAVSGNQGYQVEDGAFSDNDGLASLVAANVKADVLVLLTDVDGVYSHPPRSPNARVIEHFRADTAVSLGVSSSRLANNPASSSRS
jgi:delta-1-pyrroline-5-carboxylate synthetase